MNLNIDDLKKDKEFIERLSKVDSAEGICTLFAEKGIDVSESDAETALERVREGNVEFSAEELDGVAGGFAVETVGLIWLLCGVIGFAMGSRC